ncbi:MAG: protein kinase, partial [Verrucomicrobia bacterium]|nr:protein kinase [Verrucomicrobiota bacterium]
EAPRKRSGNPGTPAYMAPELMMRQPFDHRVDIFAFGVSAFEVLTYQKPFPGSTPAEILHQQQQGESGFTPPRELNPDIPEKLENIIIKCLAAKPTERYPFMSVVVRDLQAALYL